MNVEAEVKKHDQCLVIANNKKYNGKTMPKIVLYNELAKPGTTMKNQNDIKKHLNA